MWIGFEEGGLENERVHRISKHHHVSKAPILMETGEFFIIGGECYFSNSLANY